MKDFRPEVGLALALALAALAGCSKPSLPDQELSPPVSTGSAELPTRRAPPKPNLAASAAARAAASAVVEARERGVSLGGQPERLRHLAFGRGFLVQVTGTEVVTRNSSDGQVLERVPLVARAALALPAGSVLVAGSDAAYRFDPGEKHGHRLDRLWLLPGSWLLPDLRTQAKVWVVDPATQNAKRYAFGSDAPLAIEAERAFTDHDGVAAAILSDGDILYTAGRELVRDPGFGQPKRFTLPSEIQSVWRLAAAERVDRAWIATAGGTFFLFEMGERPRIVRRFETSGAPIDLAVAKAIIALVSVTEPSDEPRRFKVDVYAPDGTQRFSHDLGALEVTADTNWAADALRDREIVISREPLRVAVGGAGEVVLLDAGSGHQLTRSRSR